MTFIKTAKIAKVAKNQLVIIWADQIYKSYQQNCLILGKILPHDTRSSANFQVTLFQPVIIRAVQIFKSFQQKCLIFAKVSARDNRDSENFQVTS